MTPAQIKNIHIAASKAGFSRAQYEIMLANVGNVTTCKDLTNSGYEDCMALLEDHGYRQIADGQLCPPDYWRRKVARRGTFANGRLLHKIHELYGHLCQVVLDDVYGLECLVMRASESRTDLVELLTPREANNLIEMLKAIIARTTKHEETKPTKTHEESSEISNLKSEIAALPANYINRDGVPTPEDDMPF